MQPPPTRRERDAAIWQDLVRQVARPAGRGGADPNDRRYDRDLFRRLRRMRATDLDALLRDGEDNPSH